MVRLSLISVFVCLCTICNTLKKQSALSNAMKDCLYYRLNRRQVQLYGVIYDLKYMAVIAKNHKHTDVTKFQYLDKN